MWIALSIGTVVATTAAAMGEAPAAGGCPGLAAHVQLDDYDGTHTMRLCIAPGKFNVSGGVVNLVVYDPSADGIFHDQFDGAN